MTTERKCFFLSARVELSYFKSNTWTCWKTLCQNREHVVNTYSRETRRWTRHFEETAASNNSMLVVQVVKNPPAMGRPGFYPCFGMISWRRERLPIPVFRPGESHGLHPWGRKESDTTERFSLSFTFRIFKHVAKKRVLKFYYTTSWEIKYTGDVS